MNVKLVALGVAGIYLSVLIVGLELDKDVRRWLREKVGR